MALKRIDENWMIELLHVHTGHGRVSAVAREMNVNAHTVTKYMRLNEGKFPASEYLNKEDIIKRLEEKTKTKTGLSVKVIRREKDFRLHLLNHARARALRLGLDFDLELSDIKVPECCPVLGMPLCINRGSGCHDDSPSLDRIDNNKGYVWDNVLVVSGRANRIKNDSSPEELVRLATFYSNCEAPVERNPVEKGRTRFSKKLTNDQENEIKELRKQGTAVKDLASQFNISKTTVCVILRGRPKREYGKKTRNKIPVSQLSVKSQDG